MSRRVIVHIGMDKTGSSSLQQTLFSTQLPGIKYLHLGKANPSHPMKLIFEPDFAKQAKHMKAVTGLTVTQARRRGMINKFEAELSAVPFDSVAVLSAESIPNLSEEALQAMKDCLERHFDQIDVIGYVRPPVSYVQSRFQHGVRTTRKRDFSVGLGYKNRLTRIDNIFGIQNVTLIKFDRSELYKGDVVKDFVHRAGSSIATPDIITTNESMPLEAMAVLYVLNVYGSQNTLKRHQLLLKNGLSEMGSRKLKFSTEFMAPVLEECKNDIAWVEQRLGVPFWDKATDAPDAISDQDALIELALAQEDNVFKLLAAQTVKPDTSDVRKAAAARILRYDDPIVRLTAAVELLADLLENANQTKEEPA